MTSANPERALVLTYAPAASRGALAALLALDDAMARVLQTTSEPALGQMRLVWWRDSLERLDHARPPAEPVLAALADEVLPHGVRGTALASIAEGWEVLISAEALDAEALGRFALGRGTLFVAAGHAMGATDDPLEQAGQGWALADLARNLESPGEAQAARTMAGPLLTAATRTRWSAKGRALGAMAHLALRDLDLPPGAQPPIGSPARLIRLLRHRFTGR